MMDSRQLTHEDCLDFGRDRCGGDTEWRLPFSGLNSFIRCDVHWEQRIEEQQRIDEAYPDSPIAPEWFDPTYAGERWDDDY